MFPTQGLFEQAAEQNTPDDNWPFPRTIRELYISFPYLTESYQKTLVKEYEMLRFNFTLYQRLFDDIKISLNNLKENNEEGRYDFVISRMEETINAMRRLWPALIKSTTIGQFYQNLEPAYKQFA